MPALTRSDAEGLLRFVGEAESLRDDKPFPPALLTELGRIVKADWVTYCELDRVRRRVLLNLQRPGDPDDSDVEMTEEHAWEMILEEHPVCMQHQRGVFAAMKVSDFFSPAEFRRSRLYNEWFRPYDTEHELSVPIPSPLWHTKTFLFDRAGGKDFSEHDKLVLNALQPHLARLWQAARSRRLLGAALAELERSDGSDDRGVVFLSPGGALEYASPPARRLLCDFFGMRRGERLPSELEEWLASGSGRLVRKRGTRCLTVERSDETLLLHERRIEVDLTAREREVLAWVARGKTNAEIAGLLWLAPSTVRKHLENVYAKLGVNTRTAAVAHFLGLLDAEAS